jgi:glucosamine-phosphate N-acetyltransferase
MSEPSSISIRTLQKEDLARGFLESLVPLFKVGLTQEEAERVYTSIAGNPFYRIFVAESGGEIVGAATLLIEQKFILKGAKFAYLEDMSVRQDFQKKGIGTRLVEAVIKEARAEGCLNIRLDCNAETAHFYEKSGFARKDHVQRMQLNLRSVSME